MQAKNKIISAGLGRRDVVVMLTMTEVMVIQGREAA
jgi:hypothetical protein